MTIFYIDPVNGDDANDGSQWTAGGGTVGPWKTTRSGATAARIAPGDEIRIAKSPVPTSIGSCTFTHDTDTITIPSGLALKIDDGENAWTASVNVTATADTVAYVDGTKSNKLAIADGFTTGLVAYKALAGATDFSGYQQITFWVQVSAALAADVLQICLCSDTAGATPVDTLNVPALARTDSWIPVTIDKGSALGASIQSVAVYAASDPGTINFRTDWMQAAKAPGADGITLRSYIAEAADEAGPWYQIKKIDGTTLTLYAGRTSAYVGSPSTSGYFYGTSGTKNGYKREVIDYDPGSGCAAIETTESGTVSAPFKYSGGWNTASGLQDGYTWFGGWCGAQGILIGTYHYHIEIERCCVTFYYFSYGNTIQGAYGIWLHDLALGGGAADTGVALRYQDTKELLVENVDFIGGVSPLYSGSGVFSARFVECRFWNQGNPILLSDMKVVFVRCEFRRMVQFRSNTTYATLESSSGKVDARFYDCIFEHSGNNAGCYDASVSSLHHVHMDFYNCLFLDANEIGFGTGVSPLVRSIQHDQTPNLHKQWQGIAGADTFNSESTVRHTASGIAWKATLGANTQATTKMPIRWVVAVIPCAANSEVTVKAWLRRTHANLTVGIGCLGGQIAGVADDTTVSMTAAADTWEEVTLTFTPTEAGVVEVDLFLSGGNYSCYIDDMTISQA